MGRLRVAPIDTHTLITAAHLRAQFGQKLPDAIHTATAQIEACTVILTNDIGFKRIAGLKVFILSEWLDSAI